VVLREQPDENADEPTLQDLREALVGAYGTDYGAHSPAWISRFNDATRQATSYRHGRVLLAGDAAHIHAPHGGQGLNTGVQDAVNLGWKLAQVFHGTSPESLLHTYHAERHPVGARVLHNTMAQVALSHPDERHQALRDTLTELLRLDEPRRHIAAMVSGLDIHYDLGGEHPLIGQRMPDLDLHTANGRTRVFALLHDAHRRVRGLGGRARRPSTPRRSHHLVRTANVGVGQPRTETVRAVATLRDRRAQNVFSTTGPESPARSGGCAPVSEGANCTGARG
jgi:3-(3-hydroxy-phenyl)propionate hydroxylase